MIGCAREESKLYYLELQNQSHVVVGQAYIISQE